MTNPLDTYINCARLVFSVEPSEPCEDWEEFEDFEEKLREFHKSILCIYCKNLLKEPCTPKKQHFSCQHRVCLDCIGKNRQTTSTNCKMCRDFTLFEKSTQTKLILGLYQELCELIKGSWIYDYIQRRASLDTGQASTMTLIEIIESGINYGRNVSIMVESSSSSSSSSPPPQSSGDENSNSSDTKQLPMQQQTQPPQIVPFSIQTTATTFPKISPLPPVSPVQSSEPLQFIPAPTAAPPVAVALPLEPIPVQPIATAIPAAAAPLPPLPPSLPIIPSVTVSQIVSQYHQTSIVQSQLPSTSTKQQQVATQSHQLLKTSSFISHVPMRVKPMTHTTAPMSTKSIMSPMKIQQSAPTIYSVMYTGSGNKLTLKRKTPDESSPSPLLSTTSSVAAAVAAANVNTPSSEIRSTNSSNVNILKTETKNNNSNFKTPSVQVVSTAGALHQQQSHQIPIVVPTTVTNLHSTTSTSQLSNNINNSISHNNSTSNSISGTNNSNNSNDQKRRGCRCGNATAAPGKLTCCGQRCPCYVDSKACIDCKCRGCRNPHYVDGHKKMRHQVPDLQQQQQQQQNFLASIQHQTAMLKEAQKSMVPTGMTTAGSLIKSEDMNMLESTIIAKSQNSINNCIISMNSNGQYQIKPRIIMKDPTKATMSPLIFPTTSTSIGNTNNSSIQIVGVYSQVPVANEKKIIIKNEIPTSTTLTFTDPSRQHLLESNSSFTANNLNTGML